MKRCSFFSAETRTRWNGARTWPNRAITSKLCRSVGALTAAKPTAPCAEAWSWLAIGSSHPGSSNRFAFWIWRRSCPTVISAPGSVSAPSRTPVPSESALRRAGVVPYSLWISRKYAAGIGRAAAEPLTAWPKMTRDWPNLHSSSARGPGIVPKS